MDKLRIGVVGVGQIAIDAHLPAVLAFDDADVAVLTDPQIDRARFVARRFGLNAQVVGALDEALERADAFVIAMPNHLHAEAAIACLEADKHVLIEKPIAHRIEQAERVAAAASESKGVAQAGYCTRFRDNMLWLRRALEDGYFGGVHGYAYQFGTAGGWAPQSGYILDRSKAGGGVTVVSGSHFLDRVCWLLGEPAVESYRDDGEAGVEANAVMRLAHDGFAGVVRLSKTMHLPGMWVLRTDAGLVSVPESDNGSLTLIPEGKPDVRHSIMYGEREWPADWSSFERQMRAFLDACLGRRPCAVPVADALMGERLINRLYDAREPLRTDWYGTCAAEAQDEEAVG